MKTLRWAGVMGGGVRRLQTPGLPSESTPDLQCRRKGRRVDAARVGQALMRFGGVAEFLAKGAGLLVRGPVCLVLSEDGVELDSTVRHHLERGFRQIVVFAAEDHVIHPARADAVVRVRCDMMAEQALETVVNGAIGIAPAGTWMAYVYNGEYLFHPFCEDRSIGELATFCAEERRASLLTYVIDLYAEDLGAHPDGVDPDSASFDRSARYALPRYGRDGRQKERQMDFFGGLRWRFEEHVPYERRRIDRIAVFRTRPGLALRPDHTFSDEEYNTYACQWHNSPTAAIASFRVAKALRRNPGSRAAIPDFRWWGSERFAWSSQQLMDLGLMEPGQWF
jgi:hypothetical protein